jgi:F-type H+-transporting ATPase subunit alpha
VAALFAGVNGYLDDIPTDQVPRFQQELREFLRSEGDVLVQIRESGDIGDDTEKSLREGIERFKGMFNVAEAA